MSIKITLEQEKVWRDLPDETKRPFWDLIEELLGDVLHCHRDWSAWGWNTMTSSDFIPAWEDDEYVNNLAMNMYFARSNSEGQKDESEDHF